MKIYLSFISFFVCFFESYPWSPPLNRDLILQNSSEDPDRRESDGHSAGVSADRHPGESRAGAAAVLHRHHDQNHLHQLWGSSTIHTQTQHTRLFIGYLNQHEIWHRTINLWISQSLFNLSPMSHNLLNLFFTV